MSVWGKVIGGVAGFALGGPLGAMMGVMAGNIYDKNEKHPLLIKEYPISKNNTKRYPIRKNNIYLHSVSLRLQLN